MSPEKDLFGLRFPPRLAYQLKEALKHPRRLGNTIDNQIWDEARLAFYLVIGIDLSMPVIIDFIML